MLSMLIVRTGPAAVNGRRARGNGYNHDRRLAKLKASVKLKLGIYYFRKSSFRIF
jgi:hypothetical protein